MRRPLLLAAAAALLCGGCATAAPEKDEKPATAPSASLSSASPSADPAAAVRAAVTAVGGQTARTEQKVEIEGEGDTYVLTVTGGFDFAKDRGRLAVDFPGGAISHTDEVFADGKIYVSEGAGLDEGSWGVIPREEAEAHYLLRAPLNDPEHVLGQISEMRQVRREGEETVRGVRTVHYRGVLDHETLTLRMAEDVREKTREARDLLGSDLPVYADAWVDDRGRLVRTRTALDVPGVGVTVTMDLSDFGKPVRTTVPRPEDALPVSGFSGVLLG
ncbi:hypothetical protein [Streptomyces sp. BK79]|uniref:hypothetical protein n=1 Tax=Streptomyces sp. BK79 TaxID=3350097 RepID=UPI00376FD09A